MKRTVRCLAIVTAAALALAAALFFYLAKKGLSAREQPPAIEVWAARLLRHLAVPSGARELKNPVPLTPDALSVARAHFADHCASCHANDGRGRTTLGQNMYPKAPDMTLDATQSMSDGEIFYTIKNGVRLTGMPAWGKDTVEDDTGSWKLVHFIRHLPKITPEELDEMESLNPRSPAEFREAEEQRRFLEGEDSPSATSHSPHSH